MAAARASMGLEEVLVAPRPLAVVLGGARTLWTSNHLLVVFSCDRYFCWVKTIANTGKLRKIHVMIAISAYSIA
jgi:hypothetical protein